MYALVEAVRSHVLGDGTLKNLITFPIYMFYGSSILTHVTGITDAVSQFSYLYAMAYGIVYIASPCDNYLWFLPAIFIGRIMFCWLEEKTRNSGILKIMAIFLLLSVATLDSVCVSICQLSLCMGTDAFGAACMLCGYWAIKYGFTEKTISFMNQKKEP